MMFLTELRPTQAPWTFEQAQAAQALAARQTAFQPRVSFAETTESYLFLFELPGIDPQTIELTLANGELTVAGERRRFELPEGGAWHFDESTWGRFERTFAFPTAVAHDAVQAETRDGILTVKVAKAPEAVARKIPIRIIS